MKTKTKKLGILLIILLVVGLGVPLFTNNTLDLGVEEINFNNLKNSSVYNGGIQIDATLTTNTTYSGNWTWAVKQPWCDIDNDIYIIEDLTINAGTSPTGSGISIENSKNDYFIIRNCTVYNAETGDNDAGIKLENTCNGTIIDNNCTNNERNGILLISSCNNNTIANNTVNNNNGWHSGLHSGIILKSNCNYNTITENTANNNGVNGIFLTGSCVNNTISNNTVKNNLWAGIDLWTNCQYNNITKNIAIGNTRNGIILRSCDYNYVSENILYDNVENGISFSTVSKTTLFNNTANGNHANGISTYNSNNNNITQNIVRKNALSGIYLHDSDNNNITGNTVYQNAQHGFRLRDSNWNNISRNTVNDNTLIGIYLTTQSVPFICDNNTIKNNTINRNDLGIRLDQSDYNNISDNILKDNNWCIFETDCTGNLIINNDCSPPTVQTPISIDGTATGVGANNWTWAVDQPWCSGGPGSDWDTRYIIENLKISGFGIMNGIEIINSDVYFVVRNCTVYHSGPRNGGIRLNSVGNATLIDNNCSNNLYWGISLGTNCDFNTITGNEANNNTRHGIYIDDHCDNNTISYNFANYNEDTGIFLSGGSGESSYNNTISENTANDNDFGIYLENTCHFTKISGNTINGNNIGISLESGSSNNSIYENFCLKNGKHAEDDGTDNNWNSTTIGNYWDNWTGPDDNPPYGIVDTQYNISGNAESIDYLPIAEDGAPRITINSPSEGDAFSSGAPNFNVEITEDYLESNWYTIDGGLNNYTFTENGMINQSAWDDMAEGDITLKFYARDIPGYTGSAEVDIIKDTVAPVIIINLPAEGDRFGSTTPPFNITVNDDNLDVIWYSFDGGLTTFAITNNTILNQTAWTDLAQGNITITFYACDLAGNEASESVTVIKSVPSGLDPGMIITIIVVSIVGGVAVISVVYIFMKKRVVPA